MGWGERHKAKRGTAGIQRVVVSPLVFESILKQLEGTLPWCDQRWTDEGVRNRIVIVGLDPDAES